LPLDAKLLIWDKVSKAAAVPPSDPTDIVSIIKEDRLFREGRVLRSIGTEERSSTPTTTRKENTMAEARKRISEDSVITVVGKAEDGSNPKRTGSKAAERFEFYQSGQTVKEAKAAGVTATDVAYDYRHGFITLDPDPETAPEASAEGEEATGEEAPKKKRSRKKVEAAPTENESADAAAA
jgi:hypothetical protein